jgi:hypothetical protein
MNLNTSPSDNIGLLAIINPVSQSAGANTTVWVPVKNWHQFLAIIQTGVLGTAATVDAKIQQAQDSSGTGAKDITGKAITQIVKASGDNKQAFINVRADQVDSANLFTHIGVVLTVGAAASIVGGVLLGVGPRYAPIGDNVATLVQSVA